MACLNAKAAYWNGYGFDKISAASETMSLNWRRRI